MTTRRCISHSMAQLQNGDVSVNPEFALKSTIITLMIVKSAGLKGIVAQK